MRVGWLAKFCVGARRGQMDPGHDGEMIRCPPRLGGIMRADLEDLPGSFDRAVANPPYFSHGRIASAFARAAASALHPDGVLHMVAKAISLHRNVLQSSFRDVETQESGEYAVFHARDARPGPLPG